MPITLDGTSAGWPGRPDPKDVEIARLRAALEKIAGEQLPMNAHHIAREALGKR